MQLASIIFNYQLKQHDLWRSLCYFKVLLHFHTPPKVNKVRVTVSVKTAFPTITLTLTLEGKRGGGSESEQRNSEIAIADSAIAPLLLHASLCCGTCAPPSRGSCCFSWQLQIIQPQLHNISKWKRQLFLCLMIINHVRMDQQTKIVR